MAVLAPLDLFLHPPERPRRDDCLMASFHIHLRNLSLVLAAGLVQKVVGVGLLQEFVAHIGFIRQDPLNGQVVPLGLASRGRDAVLSQLSGDGIGRHSGEEVPVNR